MPVEVMMNMRRNLQTHVTAGSGRNGQGGNREWEYTDELSLKFLKNLYREYTQHLG